MPVRTGFVTTLPYGRGSVFVHPSTLSTFLSLTRLTRLWNFGHASAKKRFRTASSAGRSGPAKSESG